MDSRLVDKYIPLVNEISDKYGYDDNIKHLLYLIIPAFVTKYSIYKENLIINTFSNVRIMISEEISSTTYAFYTSIPHYEKDKIITVKYIVIQNYQNVSLVQLMDNLVHEFNHAVNSYQKEMLIDEHVLSLRTGLTYARYSLPDLSPIKKDDSYILEEILNTNQTEEIINIIKCYSDPNHVNLNTTIYSLNHETGSQYTSQAYYLENTLMKSILDNKTFLATLNNLRLSGDVEDIEGWFDHITGDKKSYYQLNQYLLELMKLEEKFSDQKFFRNGIITKMKQLVQKILNIITTFNQNCNYK